MTGNCNLNAYILDIFPWKITEKCIDYQHGCKFIFWPSVTWLINHHSSKIFSHSTVIWVEIDATVPESLYNNNNNNNITLNLYSVTQEIK